MSIQKKYSNSLEEPLQTTYEIMGSYYKTLHAN